MREADVWAVWCVRERAMTEVACDWYLVKQQIAEAVRATVLRAEHDKRNLVRVKLEKQGCEA